MLLEFWDAENGGFYFTGQSHEQLIVRSKDYFDNATPSGNSVAAAVLLRLGILTNNEDYRNRCAAILHEISDTARRYPSGFGYALSAADFYLATPKEIALVSPDRKGLTDFLREIWRSYLPNKVVAAVTEEESGANQIALLQNRTLIGGKPTAYVCEHYTCEAPVHSPAQLAERLATSVSFERKAANDSAT
jgi:uncharacterized protein